MTAVPIPASTVQPVRRAARRSQMGRLEKRYTKEKETVSLRKALMFIFKRHTETDAIADDITIKACVSALGIPQEMLSQKQQDMMPIEAESFESDELV